MDEKKSIPERIRRASQATTSVIRICRLLSGHNLSEGFPIRASNVHRYILELYREEIVLDDVRNLSDYFGAGYFELCRVNQLIKPPPPVWSEWNNFSPEVPSFHLSAAAWYRDRVEDLSSILETGEPCESDVCLAYPHWPRDTPECQADLWKRWEANRESLKAWSLKFTDAHLAGTPMLAFERTEALRHWNGIPPVKENGVEENGESRPTRSRSQSTIDVIRYFQEGMTDRQAIADRAGCSPDVVSQVKRRYRTECRLTEKTDT